MIMGLDKGINEAQNHDSMLEASKKYLGDQVMEKMAYLW